MNGVLGRRFGRPAVAAVSVTLAAMLLSLGGAGYAANGPSAKANGNEFCDPLTEFDSDDFEDSAEIDKKVYTLEPGTQFTLRGAEPPAAAAVGHAKAPVVHTHILTVTDFVKEIEGVETRVLWDQTFHDATLVASELTFQAQDEEGNVWVLGTFPVEMENGRRPTAPDTWIAGVENAEPGIVIPDDPEKGKLFLQGEFLDADILSCNEVIKYHLDDVCAAGKCYDDVLVIDESFPIAPPVDNTTQRKYYAPHVGLIKVAPVNDPADETIELIEKQKLDPTDRINADLEALALDKLGYEINEIYQQTEPVELQPCDDDEESSTALLRGVQTLKRAGAQTMTCKPRVVGTRR